MGLSFILGGSGYGKSTCMYEEIIARSIKEEKENFIIIVPEQYTLQIQKKISAMHPRHGVINVDILSFDRLAYRVFNEVEKPGKEVLSETGKTMFIRRILKEWQKEFTVFGGNAEKSGFAKEVKSMISEMMQYNVDPEIIKAAGSELPASKAMLSGKLHDMCIIMEKFTELTGRDYMSTDEILKKLYDLMDLSEIISNSYFYFDEFTGFTPSQLKVVEKLLYLSKEVRVALCVDERVKPFAAPKEHELFGITKETIFNLEKLCSKYAVARDKDIILKDSGRLSSNSDISALERNIFRDRSSLYDKPVENVKLFQCTDPYEEALFIALDIRKKLYEGYRYRDFAIVCADVDKYGRYFEKHFKDLCIPHFIDGNKSMEDNSFVKFIEDILKVSVLNYSYDSVMACVKNDYMDITGMEEDSLDNYLMATGLRGKSAWLKPFVKVRKYMKEDDLIKLNFIREKAAEVFEYCEEKIYAKGLSLKQRVEGLKELFLRLEIEAKLENTAQYFEKINDLSKAQEYREILPAVIKIMDELSSIMGESEGDVSDFLNILKEGFENEEVGIIPQGLDTVLLGNVRRSRFNDIKILYFAGLNDGYVPAAPSAGGILNDEDKNVLKDLDITLSGDSKKKAFEERFYLYNILTKPSEKLILTLSRTDENGSVMRPSSVISKINYIMPQLNAENAQVDRALLNEELYVSKMLFSEDSDRLKEYIAHIKRDEKSFESLKEFLRLHFFEKGEKKLDRRSLDKIFENRLESGITALEQYARCKYLYFLTHVLKLQKRDILSVTRPDLGIVLHSALEKFSMSMKEKGASFADLSGVDVGELIDKSVDAAVTGYDPSAFSDSAANENMKSRIKRVMTKTVQVLEYQAKKGDFKRFYYEMPFNGSLISLGDGKELKLKGKIDRMDLAYDDENVYIKIIDYKSGSKTFNIHDVIEGMDMQLFIYMAQTIAEEAYRNPNKNIKPAGVLYFNIGDPFVETMDAEEDELFKMQAKEMKMSGLVSSDERALQLMDEDFASSDVIPVKVKKDGDFDTRSSSVVSNEDFYKINDYVLSNAKNSALSILKGDIDVNPFKKSVKTACDYCEFKAVCGFNSKGSGYKYRRISKAEENTSEAIKRLVEGMNS